jgi:hypothetical protein
MVSVLHHDGSGCLNTLFYYHTRDRQAGATGEGRKSISRLMSARIMELKRCAPLYYIPAEWAAPPRPNNASPAPGAAILRRGASTARGIRRLD